MLNAIGLQNPGVDNVVDEISRRSTSARRASSPTSAVRPSRTTSRPRAASTTRPSTPSRSTSPARTSRKAACSSQRAGDVGARGGGLRAVTTKPIVTSSRRTRPTQENARRCIEAGSDGLAVINTVMAWRSTSGPPAGHRQHPGGLSAGDQADRAPQGDAGRGGGAAARRPVIGQGGICNAEDALEFSSPARRPWASALRCSTTRWSAEDQRGIAAYLAANGMPPSPSSWHARRPKKQVAACAC